MATNLESSSRHGVRKPWYSKDVLNKLAQTEKPLLQDLQQELDVSALQSKCGQCYPERFDVAMLEGEVTLIVLLGCHSETAY